ncbi:hypothetical protein O3M35_004028 [Rhynocoris fuscipes]|uniref:Uncharacterized protein n=1 Tax=Rhynocoris fuscipes TaxID=488301 RepID=A0AAW1CPF8_9HEMI
MFESEEAMFESEEVMFESEEVMFESEEVMFESEEVMFESEEAMFKSEEVMFESEEVMFESEEAMRKCGSGSVGEVSERKLEAATAQTSKKEDKIEVEVKITEVDGKIVDTCCINELKKWRSFRRRTMYNTECKRKKCRQM